MALAVKEALNDCELHDKELGDKAMNFNTTRSNSGQKMDHVTFLKYS